jgi:hypothetical protein
MQCNDPNPAEEQFFLDWSAVARSKTEFSYLFLATTDRWWPVVRQSFPTLS